MPKKEKVKEPQKRSLLEEHPRTQRSAESYFNHENGKTIIEDRVPRGDPNPYTDFSPSTPDAVTDEDLRSLVAYASEIIDEGIYRYDPDTAYRNALDHAIHDKDGGKYAGLVNANTYGVLLKEIHQKKPGPSEKTSGQNSAKAFTKTKAESTGNKKTKESSSINNESREGSVMTKSEQIKELKEKLASLEAEDLNETMAKVAEKVAVDPEARKTFKEMMAASCGEKKSQKENKEEDVEIEVESCKKYASDEILEEMDKIASEMEESGDFNMFKMAFQLDKVADVLSGKKEAATLESDPDEKYMREYFKAGKREGDKDEPYMSEFNTDVSHEVKKTRGKKASSNRPYSIID